MIAPTRALTIRDPWISAIIVLDKRIENRTWSTKYRGPIYLHKSAKHLKPDALASCRAIAGKELSLLEMFLGANRGCLIATADLVDCTRTIPVGQERWADPEAWYFILENVRPLTRAIPMRGALGFWRVPPQ